MSAVYEVDQFVSPESLEEFTRRQQAVAETIEELGLQGRTEEEGPALCVGGAALAMQGIDAYVPGRQMFDLDVLVSAPMFFRLRKDPGFKGGIGKLGGQGGIGIILPSKIIPLKVDVISSDLPEDYETFTANAPYLGQPNKLLLPVNGVHALEGSIIMAQKSRLPRARIKDVAGVIKGHVVATHEELPIVDKPLWKLAVSLAMERVVTKDVEIPLWRRIMKRAPAYPSWLKQLAATDFDHPAFVNIPRDPRP